ncbi:MAG: SlyX family protein [Xanthomonadaceae bacterium]|nr:SlyX family protein [Xanthomonadaceae bacterium]MDP2183963.1 SlyX family protein [Xanthomonadales bacterium]MDZ4116530.1 SlyX family protein [Xanthomonadaceae bacterium]MDZ4376927.1 SlyX family protein [Xanthomonadaceae bacterium]
MNTPLEARVDELEARVAFQELTVTELSDALAQARVENERTHRLLERTLDELRRFRAEPLTDPGIEPPPPHY